MKTQKNETPNHSPKQPLTLMAVQEKLGLFAQQTTEEDHQQDHDYLKKNPLGLI